MISLRTVYRKVRDDTMAAILIGKRQFGKNSCVCWSSEGQSNASTWTMCGKWACLFSMLVSPVSWDYERKKGDILMEKAMDFLHSAFLLHHCASQWIGHSETCLWIPLSYGTVWVWLTKGAPWDTGVLPSLGLRQNLLQPRQTFYSPHSWTDRPGSVRVLSPNWIPVLFKTKEICADRLKLRQPCLLKIWNNGIILRSQNEMKFFKKIPIFFGKTSKLVYHVRHSTMFLLVPGHLRRTAAEQRIRRNRAVTSGEKHEFHYIAVPLLPQKFTPLCPPRFW